MIIKRNVILILSMLLINSAFALNNDLGNSVIFNYPSTSNTVSGNCAGGYVVQNITSSGVLQCVLDQSGTGGGSFNSTYQTFAYNQTTPAITYASLYSYNETGICIAYANNQGWNSTFNSTYQTWAYNQSLVLLNVFGQYWSNHSLTLYNQFGQYWNTNFSSILISQFGNFWGNDKITLNAKNLTNLQGLNNSINLDGSNITGKNATFFNSISLSGANITGKNATFFNSISLSGANITGKNATFFNSINLDGSNITGIISISNITLSSFTKTKYLSVSNSSNSSMNRCTLVSGECTINNSQTLESTNILCMEQSQGGTLGTLSIKTRTIGFNYTVSSTNILDTSIVGCVLFQQNTL